MKHDFTQSVMAAGLLLLATADVTTAEERVIAPLKDLTTDYHYGDKIIQGRDGKIQALFTNGKGAAVAVPCESIPEVYDSSSALQNMQRHLTFAIADCRRGLR